MKWMDWSSVMEMDRGGVSEFDRQKNAKKNEYATEMVNIV